MAEGSSPVTSEGMENVIAITNQWCPQEPNGQRKGEI